MKGSPVFVHFPGKASQIQKDQIKSINITLKMRKRSCKIFVMVYKEFFFGKKYIYKV